MHKLLIFVVVGKLIRKASGEWTTVCRSCRLERITSHMSSVCCLYV